MSLAGRESSMNLKGEEQAISASATEPLQDIKVLNFPECFCLHCGKRVHSKHPPFGYCTLTGREKAHEDGSVPGLVPPRHPGAVHSVFHRPYEGISMTPKEVLQELLPLQPNSIRLPLLRVMDSLPDRFRLQAPEKLDEILSVFEGEAQKAIRALLDECERLAPKMWKKRGS